ncbi:MAG: TIGR01777 family oxidoreductase [Ilumatobacteraceae bacterium]
MRVAITGSSGLIGSALRARFGAAGHHTVPIVRRAPAAGEIGWDPRHGELDPSDLTGIDAVINLAGAGIGSHRWTDSYKRELLESRTRSTSLISEAIAAAAGNAAGGPRVLLSGSGIDVYGERGDETVDERSAGGTGFLAELCAQWEVSTAAASAAGVRVVHLRTAMVLAGRGGALGRMLPLFRLGLGGRMGSGRQWVSWISIDDEVGAIEHLLGSSVSGPVNLAAPGPVTNAEFARTLGRVLKRPAILPLPSLAPKLVLGSELVETLLLDGQRVVPRVLEGDSYVFEHPTLEGALRAVLGR